MKSELERELASEELQRTVRDTRQTVADIGADMRAAEAEARREFDAMHAQIERGAAPALDDNTALTDSDDTRPLGDSSLDDVGRDGVIHDENNDEGSDVRR